MEKIEEIKARLGCQMGVYDQSELVRALRQDAKYLLTALEEAQKENENLQITLARGTEDICEARDVYKENVIRLKAEIAELRERIQKVHFMPYQSKSDEAIPDDKCIAYELGYEGAVRDARQLLREEQGS